jgi:hypothetical protein
MAIIQADQAINPPLVALEETFHRLANVWQTAVAHHSSSSKRDNHPAYKAIIALGPPVVPLLLRDLELNRRHWFTALTAITGADPVSEDDAGKILKMVETWLRWGKEKGYRW